MKKVSTLIMLIGFYATVIHATPGEPVEVGRYETLELVFRAETMPDNPFDTYILKIKITNPNGESFFIDGFFDGDGRGGQIGKIWKARICPYIPGKWSWRTVEGDIIDPEIVGLKGDFLCIENSSVGGVVAYGQHFRFQNGDITYLQGNFLDFVDDLPSTHVFMSETLTDEMREAILRRQRDFHRANKINVYFANKGDYGGQSVTPWVGNARSNDKSRFDLARWRNYDHYIKQIREHDMVCELWFFADDSGFGQLTADDRNRLFRYAMARTSAFNRTMYVIALEWNEGWKKLDIETSGEYLQSKNPWARLLSVHSLPFYDNNEKWWKRFLKSAYLKIKGDNWPFSDQSWPTFIASQTGNLAGSSQVNELSIKMRDIERIPHISEEFGILKASSDGRLRENTWANFCGGAAGGGTGSDLKAFMNFIEKSKVPFNRMAPGNKFVQGGGTNRFCLAEEGHHYLVYSQTGRFDLYLKGRGLKGFWFDPRNPESMLGNPFLTQAGQNTFVPPEDISEDWILWVTDENNLMKNSIYPSKGASMTQINVHGNKN